MPSLLLVIPVKQPREVVCICTIGSVAKSLTEIFRPSTHKVLLEINSAAIAQKLQTDGPEYRCFLLVTFLRMPTVKEEIRQKIL
jgi:hypothetical protein